MNLENSRKRDKRKFLGIYFECCNIYSRIYKDKDEAAYQGNCPRCRKKVVVPVGENGSSSRFFVAR